MSKKGFWGGRRRDARVGFEILSDLTGKPVTKPKEEPARPTRTETRPAPATATTTRPAVRKPEVKSAPAKSPSQSEEERRAVAVKRSPRQYIYEWLVRRNARGGTDEEIQAALQLDPGTARARRVELVRMKLVIDSGIKRKTRSGRPARVWLAASAKKALAQSA